MIQGIGNDIIEIKRIESSIQRYGQRFLDKVFTAQEQDYCLRHRESHRHFAGRFAAKEAVVKALGTGLREGISWLDIEILNDDKGKPTVSLSISLQEMFNSPSLMVSISHCKEFASAVAIFIYRT
jgi:holo-[acyl-carrier protein] synthase